MAKWLDDDRHRYPAGVRQYSKRIHGGGQTGVRNWKRQALGWLAAHPGETVAGRDVLGVLRESVRLMERQACDPSEAVPARWIGPDA